MQGHIASPQLYTPVTPLPSKAVFLAPHPTVLSREPCACTLCGLCFLTPGTASLGGSATPETRLVPGQGSDLLGEEEGAVLRLCLLIETLSLGIQVAWATLMGWLSPGVHAHRPGSLQDPLTLGVLPPRQISEDLGPEKFCVEAGQVGAGSWLKYIRVACSCDDQNLTMCQINEQVGAAWMQGPCPLALALGTQQQGAEQLSPCQGLLPSPAREWGKSGHLSLACTGFRGSSAIWDRSVEPWVSSPGVCSACC